ncbi:MAG: MlaD family protein [bacterium]
MSNQVKLGIFVAVVFIVFLVFTLNITKGYLGGLESYDIYFRNVGTLEKSAQVKQAGYPVGRVSEIAPDDLVMDTTGTIERMIKVTVSVKPSAEISIDSKAHIYTAGLMGEMYVEISYGSERRLDPDNPNDFIMGLPPFSMEVTINQVIGEFVELTDGVQKTLDNINQIIGQNQARESFPKIVQNVEKLTADLHELIGGEKQTLSETLANLHQASANLRDTLARANAVVHEASQVLVENRPAVRHTFENVDQITTTVRQDIGELSESLKKTSENISTFVAKAENLIDQNEPNVSETLTNLNEASARARETADALLSMVNDIRAGRGGVAGRLIGDATLANQVEASVLKVSDMVEEASKTVSGAGTMMNGVNDVVSTVRGIPNRFALEYDWRWYEDDSRYDGKIDSNFRNDLIVRYDLTDKFFTQVGSDRIGDENELNAMLGYRYPPWTLRAGVIESEAGASLEIELFKRLILGAKGVGLTEEDEERLDAYTRFRIWDGFSLIGGVDDLTDESYFNLGVGIEF